MANIIIISKEYQNASYNWGDRRPAGWTIAFQFEGNKTTYYTFVKYDSDDVEKVAKEKIANGQYDTWPW